MTLYVYGIPNCGSCKKARQWLETNDVPYEFINTKETPPTAEQLQTWVATLGSKPMRNTSGQAYRAIAPQTRESWSDADWIQAFRQDPMLLKRPLFVQNGVAVWVGFRGGGEAIRAALGL